MRSISASLTVFIWTFFFAFSAVAAISAKDSKQLKALDLKYQKAKAVAAKVDKTLKIGLLGEERKSNGNVWISKGRVRMELEGNEKSLLVVNKSNLWAVNYPGPEFPDAPVQVIKGNAGSKKGQEKNMMSLLTVGGFLKFFDAKSTETRNGGEKVFTLMPKKGAKTDFKRAQVAIAADGKSISQIKYWDQRDNETEFNFRDVKFDGKEAFGKKFEDKLFDFSPPAGAEVMNI